MHHLSKLTPSHNDFTLYTLHNDFNSKLTPSHSCGHDNLSAITLKCITNEICECLTLIIN